MTDPTTPVLSEPAAPTPSPAKGLNVPGLISLILGVFAFILAVIPPTAFVAWAFAIAGIILAIVGLTRKNRGKATSIIGLIVSIVAWIVAIIVALVVVVGGVSSAVQKESSVTKSHSSGSTKNATSGPFGTTFTTSDGVKITVSAPKKFSPSEFAAGASHHNVKMTVTIFNGSKDKFDTTLTTFSATSGDKAGDEIFDTDHSLKGTPQAKILPGKTLTWDIGFGVHDPSDFTLDGSLGIGYDDVIWSNSK